MQILIPIISFGRAGGYRVLSQLANEWTAAGHRVDFLVDRRSEPPYFPTVASIRRFTSTGRIVDPDDSEKTTFASSGNAPSIYAGMLLALNRIGSDYDVILANHSLTTYPVALARTGRARKLYYVQAYEPEYYELERGRRARVLERLARLSYSLPLKQIANSPIYVGFREIRANSYIPPGIDPSTFVRRAAPPPMGPTRPLVLGTIGRHEPSKGTRYVLEAFERLAREDPNVRLRVAYGNLPDGWTHDRAEVVVPRNDAELAAYYRGVDVLIAAGTVQLGACHYPVLEAMASGTPLVTTRYLPADEGNSWLVPVEDSEAIARAVTEVRRADPVDLQVRLDRAARAVESFHWSYVASRFVELFA